jgi:cytochrome P450
MTSLVFDPFSAAFVEDPYDVYRRMRDEAPVYHNAKHGFYALSRFEDVQSAARDWQTFMTEPGVELDDWGNLLRVNSFLNLDPPRHDELRNVVRRHFSPVATRELAARVRETAGDLLRAVLRGGGGDLAQEFAWPLPVRVSASLLGLPRGDDSLLNQLLRTLVQREPGRVELPEASFEAARELRAYFERSAKTRRRDPNKDVLDTLVVAEAEGRITMGELVDLCCLLFIAAIDTVASIILNSLVQLERHPEQRQWLAEHPSGIATAVEELLRFEPPAQYLARTTKREVSMHGTTIPASSRVLLVFAAANRDERRFSDPDRLDIRREPRRSLAFGDGIKFCLGAPLARLEAAIALELVLDSMPTYRIMELRRSAAGPVRGIDRLLVLS